MTKKDINVENPLYYTEGRKIQPIEIVRELLSIPPIPQNPSWIYYEGQVLKYLCRFRQKNGVEDLKKARVYLDWLIQEMSDSNFRRI